MAAARTWTKLVAAPANHVANDARVSGRHWDSQTLRRFMAMRQPMPHLTADEIDSAIGHATHRRDHPLTAVIG